MSEPPDDLVGLDPWTAGYVKLRQYLESGQHTNREVDELIEAIRATLPHPSPPQLIELVILVNIKMAESTLPTLGALVNKMWAARIWAPNPSYFT